MGKLTSNKRVYELLFYIYVANQEIHQTMILNFQYSRTAEISSVLSVAQLE
jgi:hypothetical protein